MDKKTLKRVLSGLADRNIRFLDLIKLLNDFGFSVRIKGDNHIFYREGIEEIINLQPLKDGKAKAYQVTSCIKGVRMHKYELIIY